MKPTEKTRSWLLFAAIAIFGLNANSLSWAQGTQEAPEASVSAAPAADAAQDSAPAASVNGAGETAPAPAADAAQDSAPAQTADEPSKEAEIATLTAATPKAEEAAPAGVATEEASAQSAKEEKSDCSKKKTGKKSKKCRRKGKKVSVRSGNCNDVAQVKGQDGLRGSCSVGKACASEVKAEEPVAAPKAS